MLTADLEKIMIHRRRYRRASTEFWPTVQTYTTDTAVWLEELKKRFDNVATLLSRSDGSNVAQIQPLLSEVAAIEEELDTVLSKNFYRLLLAAEQHVDELESDEY